MKSTLHVTEFDSKKNKNFPSTLVIKSAHLKNVFALTLICSQSTSSQQYCKPGYNDRRELWKNFCSLSMHIERLMYLWLKLIGPYIRCKFCGICSQPTISSLAQEANRWHKTCPRWFFLDLWLKSEVHTEVCTKNYRVSVKPIPGM